MSARKASAPRCIVLPRSLHAHTVEPPFIHVVVLIIPTVRKEGTLISHTRICIWTNMLVYVSNVDRLIMQQSAEWEAGNMKQRPDMKLIRNRCGRDWRVCLDAQSNGPIQWTINRYVSAVRKDSKKCIRPCDSIGRSTDWMMTQDDV